MSYCYDFPKEFKLVSSTNIEDKGRYGEDTEITGTDTYIWIRAITDMDIALIVLEVTDFMNSDGEAWWQEGFEIEIKRKTMLMSSFNPFNMRKNLVKESLESVYDSAHRPESRRDWNVDAATVGAQGAIDLLKGFGISDGLDNIWKKLDELVWDVDEELGSSSHDDEE